MKAIREYEPQTEKRKDLLREFFNKNIIGGWTRDHQSIASRIFQGELNISKIAEDEFGLLNMPMGPKVFGYFEKSVFSVLISISFFLN